MKTAKLLFIIGLFLATSLNIFGQGIVFFDPAEGTRQVKWNPDGTLIATANPDGKVWIWDTNGQLLTSFVADPLGVYTIDWHPNGTRLASSGTDLFVKIWNVTDLNNVTLSSSFSLTTETTAYTEGLFELLWHPDGIQLLTLGFNQAHAWDSLAGQPINSLPAPAAYDMEFSPDHTQLAMIIGFFQLHIIGVNDFSTNIWMRPLDETSIMRISWSPDIVNPTIASGDVTGHVRLWNLGNQTISDVLVSIPSVIQDILWSPDGNRLVIATNSGHLYTVDAQTGEILGTTTANGPILYADWQPDGNEVVYVAYDGDSDPTNDLQIIVPPDVIACSTTIPHRTTPR